MNIEKINNIEKKFHDFIKKNEKHAIMYIFNRPLDISDNKLKEIEKKLEQKLKDGTKLKDNEIFENLNKKNLLNMKNLKEYAKKIGIPYKYFYHYKTETRCLLIIKIIIKLKSNNYSYNNTSIINNSSNTSIINNNSNTSIINNISLNNIKESNENLKKFIFLNEEFLEYTINYNNSEKYKTKKYLSKNERKFKFILKDNETLNHEQLIKNEQEWLYSLVKKFKIHNLDNIKPNMGKIGEDIIFNYFKFFKPHINTTDVIGKNIRIPKTIYNTLDIDFPVENSFCLKKKPKNKKIKGFKYDLEDSNNYYEIKTSSYYETGTANEKIAGVPWKYINTFEACNKPLKIICLFGAEKWAKDIGLIKTANEKISNNKIKLRDYINNDLHIEFLGFSDILKNDLNVYKEGDKKLKNMLKS